MISKPTDPTVAGNAQNHTHSQKMGFLGVCIFGFWVFFEQCMLHAFSVSLVCTGAFWDRSAVLWKEAVKPCYVIMSCYVCHVVLCISCHITQLYTMHGHSWQPQ